MSTLISSHLYREMREQPEVLARLLEAEQPAAEALAAEIIRRRARYLVIAARGSSGNAARYANYLLGAVNGLVVALATPSLYTLYGSPPSLEGAVVLGISQSGKSPDIVAVVAEGRRQGALTAAITNEPGSDLGRTAEHVLALHAGAERSVAATKTYTAELAAIALLSCALVGDSQRSDELRRVPRQVAEALELPSPVVSAAERCRTVSSSVVLGRGYNNATAFELALKLKELTYTLAEPYSSADFLHGPLALVGQGFPAIVIAPSGIVLPEVLGLVSTLRQREAELMVISDNADALATADLPLPLPVGVPEWLSPITAILPGQLLALHLAVVRGIDPDRPRGLRKVTETR
ncbi:MAG TPA: SIS domain-containing protein [Anaerolineae bacterium]|nr:SIS domain-containing protein [Anaerolineae bacterium]